VDMEVVMGVIQAMTTAAITEARRQPEVMLDTKLSAAQPLEAPADIIRTVDSTSLVL